MKLQDAKDGAAAAARESGLPIVVVEGGPHADEFAERDEGDKSYGYCPEPARHILYRFGTVIETIQP